MAKVRLREGSHRTSWSRDSATTVPSLRVSGVVVRKADLVETLRVLVPSISDIHVTEDGEYFWLMLGHGGQNGDSSAEEK